VIGRRDADPDDAGRPGLVGLGLHPYQRELAGLVDALGELDHLLVLAGLAQRLHYRLVRGVVDAGAEHEGDRHRGKTASSRLRIPGGRAAVNARSHGARSRA
jgi:hypothetical protein